MLLSNDRSLKNFTALFKQDGGKTTEIDYGNSS
jgi:hypothetical protein